MRLAIYLFSLVGAFHVVSGYPTLNTEDSTAVEDTAGAGADELVARNFNHLSKRGSPTAKKAKWCNKQVTLSRPFYSYSDAVEQYAKHNIKSYDFTSADKNKINFGALTSQFLSANPTWKGETEHAVEAQLLGIFIAYLNTPPAEMKKKKLPVLKSNHYIENPDYLDHPYKQKTKIKDICEYLTIWYGTGTGNLPAEYHAAPPKSKEKVSPMGYIAYALPGNEFEPQEFTFLAKYPNLEKGRAWGLTALRTDVNMDKKFLRNDNLEAYVDTLRKFIGAYSYHIQSDVRAIFTKQVNRIGDYMDQIEKILGEESAKGIKLGGKSKSTSKDRDTTWSKYYQLDLKERWLAWFYEYQANRQIRLQQFVEWWATAAVAKYDTRIGAIIDPDLEPDNDDRRDPDDDSTEEADDEDYFFAPPSPPGAPKKNPKDAAQHNFLPVNPLNPGPSRNQRRAPTVEKVDKAKAEAVKKRVNTMLTEFQEVIVRATREGWGVEIPATSPEAKPIGDPETPTRGGGGFDSDESFELCPPGQED